MDSIEYLLTAQDELNEFIYPNWKKILTTFDYSVACSNETTEVIDCLGWKWWKKQNPVDYESLKLELVDVLHFALSGHILSGCGLDITPIKAIEPSLAELMIMQKYTGNEEFYKIIRHVFGMAKYLNFNIDLYYIAKRTLNYIRQMDGYKS
jgi:dimeric dUTPase (all-alpha-NTP-PPase superfamily)